MNQEAIIKGRIAEHIVEFLLEESGYKVARIAYEGLLVNIARESTGRLNKSEAGGKITNAPSFAVVDKSGKELALVKVKYRKSSARGGNIVHGLKQLRAYWPEALLVVVMSDAPFLLVRWQGDLEGKMNETFPRIKKDSLLESGRLIQKFLK